MTVGELIEILKNADPLFEVMIKARTHNGNVIGPSQAIPLDNLSIGFDWNYGRVTMHPKEPLRLVEFKDTDKND